MKNKLAKEWLDRGKQDLEVAQIIFSKSSHIN